MDLQTLWCLWQIWSMCGRGAVWGVIWEHSGLSGVRHSPIHSCWRSSYWWWWWWRSFFLAVFKQDLGENNCDLRPLRKPKRVREKIRTGCFVLKLLLRQQFDSTVDWCLFLFLQQSVEKFWPFGVLKMFKLMVFFSACCYLQSFILSFHGRRQAISCLLNLMAPLSPGRLCWGPNQHLQICLYFHSVQHGTFTSISILEVQEEHPGQGLTV